MMINDLIPHEKLGQQKARVLDAQDEAFHKTCKTICGSLREEI